MCCFEQLTAGGAVVLQIFFLCVSFINTWPNLWSVTPGIFFFFFFFTIEDFSNVCISCSFDKLKIFFLSEVQLSSDWSFFFCFFF